MNEKVELYILAGFLGSGKTTLLQKILEEEKKTTRKVAVLLNELGEFSVDTEILGRDTPLKELLKGCICCTMKDEVEIQIHSLYQQHKPDVIYIETTGVAHPMEVFDACLSPLVAPFIRVKGIITVVDALRFANRKVYDFKLNHLLEEQVKCADLIILNKINQVSETQLDNMKVELNQLNFYGKKVYTNYCQISIDEVGEYSPHNLGHYESSHVHNDLRIRTVTYTFQNLLNRTDFENWLRQLPHTVYRLKGYLRFEEEPRTTYLFQYSYGVPLYIEERMKLAMTIVVIGSDLDQEKLIRDLERIDVTKSV